MTSDKACFFMLCTDRMESECLAKGLFGVKEWRLVPGSIEKGDIGFLVNVSRDQILGIFEAERPGPLDIDRVAWGGEYPAQVNVKLLGELQRVQGAMDKLGGIVEIKRLKRDWDYEVPAELVHGPEVTRKVLSLFEESDASSDFTSKQESRTIADLMTDLVAHVKQTDSRYKVNFEPSVRTHPIPFFGDLESAEVITVGVNPSAGEFKGGRNWPSSLPPDELLTRLKGYFKLPDIPPHPWFQKWEEGLQLLNCSYRRDAAHLDLSPRATIAMSQVPDKDLFERMIRADIQWFFKFLQCSTSATLMLIAGAVTNEFYMNEFLAEHAPRFGFRLDGSLERSPGQAKTAHHTLIGPGVDLPVFFCSVSPSAKNSDLLVERIRENRDSLTQHLSS